MNLETLFADIKSLAQSFTWSHWAAIGAALFLLFLLPVIGASRRKKRRRKVAPQLALEAFQISPLGRDAFLKFKNNGEVATISAIAVRGRNDLVFKNAFAGHTIEKGKTYSILMETVTQDKITHNFSMELTFFDQHRNVYRQIFDLSNLTTRPPKLMQTGR